MTVTTMAAMTVIGTTTGHTRVGTTKMSEDIAIPPIDLTTTIVPAPTIPVGTTSTEAIVTVCAEEMMSEPRGHGVTAPALALPAEERILTRLARTWVRHLFLPLSRT